MLYLLLLEFWGTPGSIQMPGTFCMENLQTPDGGEDFLLIYQEFYWSIDTPTNKIKLKGTSCEAVEIQILAWDGRRTRHRNDKPINQQSIISK